jgi:hypothetical protein
MRIPIPTGKTVIKFTEPQEGFHVGDVAYIESINFSGVTNYCVIVKIRGEGPMPRRGSPPVGSIRAISYKGVESSAVAVCPVAERLV